MSNLVFCEFDNDYVTEMFWNLVYIHVDFWSLGER